MADQTTASITIAARPATVMGVIADFDAYPEWATGVQKTEVLDSFDGGRAERVRFELSAGPIKDTYTLAYEWDGDREVRWGLVEAGVLKAMDGAYTLTPAGEGRTEVTYRLSVDVSIPMIGLLKRKAEKVIIDTALKGLQERVESGG